MQVPINSNMARDRKSGAVLIEPDQSAAQASRNARQRVLKTEERLSNIEERQRNIEERQRNIERRLNLYNKLA